MFPRIAPTKTWSFICAALLGTALFSACGTDSSNGSSDTGGTLIDGGDDTGDTSFEGDCTTDSDCAGGELCVAGQCLVGCANDADCSGGECVDNVCQSIGCTTAQDCAADEACEAGACVPAVITCTDNRDCSGGELCRDGSCVPIQPDCSDGESECLEADLLQVCEDGRWVQMACGDSQCVDGECQIGVGCSSNRDCSGGEECIERECVPIRPGCEQGATECADAETLLYCDDGQWFTESCESGQCADGECGDVNACGGSEPIDALPGSECGSCGEIECDGPNDTVCNDRELNACGGCAELEDQPGERCGPGGRPGEWVCSGPNTVRCEEPNPSACESHEDCAQLAEEMGFDGSSARCDAEVGCFTNGSCNLPGGEMDDPFNAACPEGTTCVEAFFGPTCAGCTANDDSTCREGETCDLDIFTMQTNCTAGFGFP